MPGEKLDITKEEMKSLTEAMKKEEFRKLLMDYAEELADPEKRKLYEDELAQLESQRGVDMRFIKPEPGFVLKTTDSSTAKVFINICSSGEVAVPEMEPAEQRSGGTVERGQQCSLPYSLSPCHKETDNKGAECEVYDVVFNPETLRLCSNPGFKNMVINTALDGVVANFKVQLNREVKFPKIKFKGTPSQCVIRRRVNEEQPDAFDHLPKRPNFPDLPEETATNSKTSPKPHQPASSKPSNEPDYKIVYRDEVKMGDFVNERVSSGSRPSQLIITISLPKHGSAREVDLDVYSDSLDLKSEHYVLSARIPYKVDSDRGRAKFDKSTKELVVTLDVLPQVVNEEDFRSESVPCSSLVGDVEPDSQDHPESTAKAQQVETAEPTQQSDPENVESVSDPIVESVIEPLLNTVEQSEPLVDSGPIEFTDYSEVLKSVETEIKRLSLKEQQSKKSAEADKPAQELESEMSESVEGTPTEDSGEAADVETNSDLSSIEIVPSVDSCNSDISEHLSDRVEPYPAVSDTFVEVELPSSASPDMPTKLSDIGLVVKDNLAVSSPRSRFNVSPVPCTEDPSNKHEPEEQDDDELFVLDDMNSVDFLTDSAGENKLSVAVRVYQDMSTATVLIDTTFNSVPEVVHSGKKVWLRNEDISLYLILPHSVTTFTIDMSVENVCFVVYKQHKALWHALHIGHSEEEVYSYKFLTLDNADHMVGLFGDPWVDIQDGHVTTHVTRGDRDTTVSYTVDNKPSSLPIYLSDTEEDPSLKGILKSPHSPPPTSPRGRQVSFNDAVETFVLPSKRSQKGKKRRKKGSGSSASESSDDASSPSPSSPLHTFRPPPPRAPSGESSLTAGLILDSASSDQSSGSTAGQAKKKNKKKAVGKNNIAADKENVMQTQSEVVKCLDPSGAATHRMSLGNSHIYELED